MIIYNLVINVKSSVFLYILDDERLLIKMLYYTFLKSLLLLSN